MEDLDAEQAGRAKLSALSFQHSAIELSEIFYGLGLKP